MIFPEIHYSKIHRYPAVRDRTIKNDLTNDSFSKGNYIYECKFGIRVDGYKAVVTHRITRRIYLSRINRGDVSTHMDYLKYRTRKNAIPIGLRTTW